mgnify:CR=1 FL=1
MHALIVQEVGTLTDPRLAPYANLTDAALRRTEFEGRNAAFICESELVVRSLLASDWPVHSLLLTHAMLPRLEAAIASARAARAARGQPNDFPVLLANQSLLESITGFGFHRGVLAAGLRRPVPLLEALLEQSRTLVILEGLSNHDNVGAIFRNVAGLCGGSAGVILGPGCCDPLYRKSVRVSVGHVLHVAWTTLDERTFLSSVSSLRGAGFLVIALSPRPDAIGIADLRDQLGDQLRNNGGNQGSNHDGNQSRLRVALLLGAEGPGLSQSVMSMADQLVRIPMCEGVDSLNVATAGAIALSWLANRDH